MLFKTEFLLSFRLLVALEILSQTRFPSQKKPEFAVANSQATCLTGIELHKNVIHAQRNQRRYDIFTYILVQILQLLKSVINYCALRIW